MVDPSRTVTVAGLPALSTGPLASSLADAPLSAMRAETPTRITALAATSDTATIFRWVVRSAVTSEWFIGISPPVLIIGRGNRAAGSIKQRGFEQKVSLTVTDLPSFPSSVGRTPVETRLRRDSGDGSRRRISQPNQGHKPVRGTRPLPRGGVILCARKPRGVS